jgi:hypothetical protein
MGKMGKDTLSGNNIYDIKEILGMSKKRSGARKLGKKERYPFCRLKCRIASKNSV